MSTTTTESLAVKQQQASTITGLGRSRLLELSYSGQIPSYKVGVSRYWRIADLVAWVESQPNDLGP